MSIDVRVPHPAYAAARLSIMAARDCMLGERAVKARADLYLPRLTGQTVVDYLAYKTRATFYSIVGRTISALTGLAVQGDVSIAGNPETVSQMTDAPHGMQLTEANIMSVAELLLQGRYGILLDAPEQAKTVGLYGYVSDAIINWDVDGTGAYTMVVLQERRLVVDQTNRFKRAEEDQFRVLELVNGVYTVQMYDHQSNPIGAPVVPTFMGKTIDFIPFFTALPTGMMAGVTKSPMEDMVNVNLSHYRTSADLEHGRHFCGLPTPVVTGADVAGKLKIGGAQAWVLPDQNAKAFFLEFTGQGLGSLEKALVEKEAQLVSLSASIISRSAKGSESPDAIRLRMSSETAALFTIVKTVETFMTEIYNTKASLEGQTEDVKFAYPFQFVSGHLTAEEIVRYSKVYLEGGLPLKDYVTVLRRGGVLSATRTDQEVTTDLDEMAQKLVEASRVTVPTLSPQKPATTH